MYQQQRQDIARGPWTGTIELGGSNTSDSFVTRPGEVLVPVEVADGLAGEVAFEVGSFALVVGVDDVDGTVRRLRRRGVVAQPNHVVFADATVRGNPATFPNPATLPNPLGFGHGSSGCCSCHSTPLPLEHPVEYMKTTAVSASKPDAGVREPDQPDESAARVVVLDTGLAATAFRPDLSERHSPMTDADVDEPNENADAHTDPFAGHGTFIAGIVERIAPNARVRVDRVLSTFGHGDDADIALVVHHLLDGDEIPEVLIMSFGAYAEGDVGPVAITEALQRARSLGVVCVASAGNSASCRPQWPAAQPEVIGVGALATFGAAPFTNFGPWVDACAPGVEVRSRFFRQSTADGAEPVLDAAGAAFDGWATWSGSSFSAPAVAATIANRLPGRVPADRRRLVTDEAVRAVVKDRSLFRLPGLGTVVNAS